jgi:hypothetical protein
MEVYLIHYLKEFKRFYAELLNITKSLILLILYLERNFPSFILKPLDKMLNSKPKMNELLVCSYSARYFKDESWKLISHWSEKLNKRKINNRYISRYYT